MLPVDESISAQTEQGVPPDLLAEITLKKVRLAEMAARKIRRDNELRGTAQDDTVRNFYKPAPQETTGPYSAFTIAHSWPGITVPLRQVGVIACGIAASILVTIAIVAASRRAGFDLFATSPWIAISVGTPLTGIATAAGYQFGCWLFRCRATWLLLIQMVVIAEFYPLVTFCFTQRVTVLETEFALP